MVMVRVRFFSLSSGLLFSPTFSLVESMISLMVDNDDDDDDFVIDVVVCVSVGVGSVGDGGGPHGLRFFSCQYRSDGSLSGFNIIVASVFVAAAVSLLSFSTLVVSDCVASMAVSGLKTMIVRRFVAVMIVVSSRGYCEVVDGELLRASWSSRPDNLVHHSLRWANGSLLCRGNLNRSPMFRFSLCTL